MTEDAQAPRDEGSRTYRPKLVWKLAYGSCCALIVGLGVALAAGAFESSNGPSWAAPIMGSVGIAIGALLLVALAVDRIVLHGADEIEVWQLGSRRQRLRREQIRGRRLLRTPYLATLVLERTDGRRPIEIPLVHERDDILNTFLDSLTDLDQVDRAAAEQALLQTAELGATEADRRQTLLNAHRFATAMNGIALATILWGYVYPHPRTIVVLALSALPLAVVLALGRGVFSVVGARNDPRPHLTPALMPPPLILAARSILDVSFVDFATIASVAAAIAGLFLALLVAVMPPDERRLRVVLALALVAAAYGWGVGSHANVLPDRSPPHTYAVEVRGERVSPGSHPSTYLTLAPWGPFNTEEEYTVSRDVHDRVEVGGTACADLHLGALGARWYVIRPCE